MTRLMRTTRDITASEIAMLALESDPATDDFVMIPKGTVGRVLSEENGFLDMEFDIPDLIGACGCFLSPESLEEISGEPTINWSVTPGNLKLDPEEQLAAEEWIAAHLFDFDYAGESRPNEEECARLSRAILLEILSRFRPDLVDGAGDPELEVSEPGEPYKDDDLDPPEPDKFTGNPNDHDDDGAGTASALGGQDR